MYTFMFSKLLFLIVKENLYVDFFIEEFDKEFSLFKGFVSISVFCFLINVFAIDENFVSFFFLSVELFCVFTSLNSVNF